MHRASQFAALFYVFTSCGAATAGSPWNGYWILDPTLNPQAIKDQAADDYRFHVTGEEDLRWEIPSLHEVVDARLDGQPAEIKRPGSNGLTLAVKAEGPRVLLYRVARGGKDVGEGRMTLVNNDTEWVDISQPFGHPENAGAVVYTKAPDPSDPAVPALRAAIRSPLRSPSLVARDPARHPFEVLGFGGVRPDATVLEIWPGAGYWTEILAPYLRDKGHYTVALGSADGDQTEKFYATAPTSLQQKSQGPQTTDNQVHLAKLSSRHSELGAPGSEDIVLTFRNLHNWMAEGDALEILATIYKVLKPGGVLVLDDHRAKLDRPQDPHATTGYVREDYAIALIEKAGFKLDERSEIEANPRDTSNWPQGVWTLPPTFALGQKDREKYKAIGEADNFLLKFHKPG